MEEFKSISRFDIESKLSNELLRIARIICFTMVAGVTIFFLLILFMYSKYEGIDEVNQFGTDLTILSYVVIVIALIDYTIFILFPRFFLRSKNIFNKLSQISSGNNQQKIDNPVIKLIVFDRIYMIIRMAMLEGIALFGMVILFQAVTYGQIYQAPILWLWVIPGIILGYFAFKNYLYKESYIDRIENEILVKLK